MRTTPVTLPNINGNEDMTLEQEMQEIINKHLPAQVGEALKERLLKAEQDASRCGLLVKELDTFRQQNKQLSDELSNANKALNTFQKREADLLEREKQILKLELTAQFESEKCSLVTSMFQTVFQNRVVRENSLVQKKTTYDSGNGGYKTESTVSLPESRVTEEG